MSDNFPDDAKTENENVEVDMTELNEEVFVTPVVRMDGPFDEMPEGLVINPKFLGPLVLTSPDGSQFTLTVTNGGGLGVVPINP
jgi:hypothetical protein